MQTLIVNIDTWWDDGGGGGAGEDDDENGGKGRQRQRRVLLEVGCGVGNFVFPLLGWEVIQGVP